MKGDYVKSISVLGTGWLGLPLSEHLSAKGFVVRGSTRSSNRMDSLLEKGIQPFTVDLSSGDLGSDGFFESQTLIINIPFKDVPAFSGLIERLEKSNIQNVIFVSSTSVYGNKNSAITEDDTDCLLPCPLLEIENLFTSNKHFLTTIVRFGGLVGYSRNPALFFKSGKWVPNPESKVNLIHRDDCINIIYSIIQNEAWGKIYNCCSDTHPTKRAFYTYAAKSSGLPCPNFSTSNDRAYKEISNNKVKADLNYSFVYPDLLDMNFSTESKI